MGAAAFGVACVYIVVIGYTVMSTLQKRQLDNGEIVFFSHAEKQSEKGFTSNKRLLLLLQNRFLCYFSNPSTQFPLSIEYLHKNAKTVVPLTNIHRLNYCNDNKLEVDFWVFENNRRISKTWLLRMDTPALLGAWQQIFDQYSNRSRKGTGVVEESIRPQAPSFEGNVNDSVARITNKQKSPPKPQVKLPENNLAATISKEVTNSNYLLREDPSESYFANLYAVSPSQQAQQNFSSSSKLYTLERPERKVPEFTNYYRPYLDEIFQLESSLVRITQFNEIDSKYKKFIEYATRVATELVDLELQGLLREQEQKKNQGRSGTVPVIVLEREDVKIELGLVELKHAGVNAYVCDQTFTKRILANFKNLNFVHKSIAKVPLLRSSFFVPMSCLITYKGFILHISSKVDTSANQDYFISTHNHPTGQLFDLLSETMKVDFRVFEDYHRIEFIPINSHNNRFAVVHARSLLPQLQAELPIRQAALQGALPEERRVAVVGSRETEHQNFKIAEHLLQKIKELSDLLNKLEVYPITPFEMGPILHSFGINIKYIGRIYPNLSQSYVQAVFKTEAAVRAFKVVFAKKMQDTMRQWGTNALEEAAMQLLNAFMGRGEDCTQLWKVVSLHSQKYFGLSVRPEQINKGYLLLGLSQHLSADIHPSSSNVDQIFRCDSFVEGVKFHPKLKASNLLPSFLSKLQHEYDVSSFSHLSTHITHLFQLQEHPFPTIITTQPFVYSQLLLLLSLYTSPRDNMLSHLAIYQEKDISPRLATGAYLQRKLAELRWEIKQNSPRDYILILADRLRQSIQDYYGEFHPFISDVWQLQGLYLLSIGQQEPAVSANKKALSNMVACCGNNQGHLKLSNTHYHISQCLTHYRRLPEALSHLRKAKHILDLNNYQKQPAYAHLLTKISIILLHQYKDTESYQCLQAAASIYEQHDVCSHWDQLVEIYEMMTRCQIKPQTQQLQGIRLAQHCVNQLETVLNADGELCSDPQLARILKIALQQFLLKIRKEDKHIFREYLFQICDFMVQAPEANEEKEALLYFRAKVAEGAFLRELQNWVSGAGEMVSRWWQEGGTRGLQTRSEAVQAFDYFMHQVVGLLGECFLANILK